MPGAAVDAAYDELTQVVSAQALAQRLAEAGGRVGVRGGGDGAVLCLDLDRFEPLKKWLGAAAAARVLREVVTIIKGCIRADDLVARLGHGDFVIVLPEGGRSGALRVAQDIKSRAARIRARGDGARLRVSLSVGIAEVGPEESLASGYGEALAAAEAALREAKQAGGDAIKIHR